MRLGFLDLPADERRVYIEQAAVRRNVSPVVPEKDFWVCWLLGVLLESEFAGSLVFKGGTSPSKVFGVIERFSEDSDRSLSPTFLNLPDAGTSRNQANKWMTRAEAACGATVRDRIGPAMEAAAVSRSGEARAGVVRVPDGSSHELAGLAVSLPVVAAGRVRVPQPRGEAGSASYRRSIACPRCGGTTRRCGTCISLSRPASVTSLRPWLTRKGGATTAAAAKSCSGRTVGPRKR